MTNKTIAIIVKAILVFFTFVVAVGSMIFAGEIGNYPEVNAKFSELVPLVAINMIFLLIAFVTLVKSIVKDAESAD